MKLTEYKQQIRRNLSNAFGWTTSRKYVIFESDDWGSIRMPSLKALKTLENQGLKLTGGEMARYNQNDSLATDEDLTLLFNVLSSHIDRSGNPAAFTAVTIVANPDFQKIASANFERYYFEPFTDTLKRYYGNDQAYKLWMQGIEKKIFVPQFHGREHLNVPVWLLALRQGDRDTRLAFDQGLWSFKNLPVNGIPISYQAAFDLLEFNDLDFQKNVISSGLDLFEKLFGYRATFFVPPNGPINNLLEKTASDNGVKFISTSKIQLEALGAGKIRRRFHYIGQINKHGQRYITRNCFFEPNQPGTDWVNSCISEIAVAFRWNKPAVISTHRTNYIGALSLTNRKNGLNQLNLLLDEILKTWPDVHFITSEQLGFLIERD